MIGEEILEAAIEVFAVAEDLPQVTLRRYSKGMTKSAQVDGVRTTLPVGAPIVLTAIMQRRGGSSSGGMGHIMIEAPLLGTHLGFFQSPDFEWSYQEVGGSEHDVTSDWKPLGAAAGKPVAFSAQVELGGRKPLGTQ